MQGIKKIMALLWRTESNLECTRECSGDLKHHLKIVLRISQTLTTKFTFEWKSQSLAVSYSLELKSLIRYDLLWAMGRISLPKKQRKFIGLQLVPGVIIASEPYEWISHLRKLIRRSHNEWPDFLFSDSGWKTNMRVGKHKTTKIRNLVRGYVLKRRKQGNRE